MTKPVAYHAVKFVVMGSSLRPLNKMSDTKDWKEGYHTERPGMPISDKESDLKDKTL